MATAMDQHLAKAKECIERNETLQRLLKNRDFKKLITEYYLKVEASRCVAAKAYPSMQAPERQAVLDKQINAIGYFAEFLRSTEGLAAMAKSDILEAEALPELDEGQEYVVEE